MHVRLAALLLATLAVAAAHPRAGQTPAPSQSPATDTPEGWPDEHRIPDSPAEDPPQALPGQSMTEPFAIGEALYDPARVDAAVVSLLTRMGAEIVPDRPDEPVAIGAARMRLSESEVRALIDMGIEDAEAQAQDPSGPFTFRDLHATLAPALRNVSAEQLAEAYAEAYERQPEAFAAQVLMGQPIEVDMPLLRTQIWLLHADGVLSARQGAGATIPRPRLVLARTLAAQGAQASGYFGPTGHLSKVLQPVGTLSGMAWAELQLRLPLIAASSVTLTQGAALHERHAGSAPAVTLQARVQLRSIHLSSTGTAIHPVPLVNGLPVTWQVDSAITAHASPASPLSTTVGMDGMARLTLAPRPEAAQGKGVLASESGRASVRFEYADFVKRYQMNVPAANIRLPGRGTDVQLEWHAPEGIEFRISNNYDVGTFGLTRAGWDYGIGSMQPSMQPGEEGVYRGKARLISRTDRMTMPGRSCVGQVTARQWADVVGVPIEQSVPRGSRLPSFYTEVHQAGHYRWRRGQAATYLRLEFTPTSRPYYVTSGSGVICQDEIPHRGSPNFVPLNDAQWTITGFGDVQGVGTANRAGYAIAVPDEGLLRYEDRTSENASLVTSQQFGSVNLGGLLKARSIWYVSIIRTKVQ